MPYNAGVVMSARKEEQTNTDRPADQETNRNDEPGNNRYDEPENNRNGEPSTADSRLIIIDFMTDRLTQSFSGRRRRPLASKPISQSVTARRHRDSSVL